MAKQSDETTRPAGLRYWPTWLFFALMSLVGRLPYSWLVKLGRGFGRLMYRFAGSRTRIASINIRRCFPQLSDTEQQQLVKENLIETGIGMLETAMLWFGHNRNWQSIVEFKGLEHLEKAQQDGRGGLLLAFHLTSLEIGGSLLGTRYPIGALYRRNENPAIEFAMVKGRKRFVEPIPREATREMIKYLKSNRFVWYAADQDYGRRQSIFVPFFDIPTATITATTRFARLSKAPVIPMTQRRIDGKRIEVTIHPPLTGIGADERQDAITINQFLEQYLAQHPADYLWVHRRFKTRPNETDPSFYPKKKKTRPVTPERYKNIMEAALWVEEIDNRPVKLQLPEELVYFFYYDDIFLAKKRRLKAFIETHKNEQFNDKQYVHKGKVRLCQHRQCYLVYLEEI